MSNQLNVDIASLSRSVGFLVDRVGEADIVLGCAWLLDADKVATCAHLVLAYEHEPAALKLFFPASKLARGVNRVVIHPRFDRRSQGKAGQAAPKTELARLRQYDAAILLLAEAPSAISDNERQTLDTQLTAPIPSSSHGLSGKLSEIDFFLIVQTINKARKTGRLFITDSRNNAIAGVFCQDGLVTHVFFGNLNNELAFYQIVQKQCQGNFYFESRSEPDWEVDKPISRPPEMLLLEAHRRLEETQGLLASLGGAEIVYGKCAKLLDLSVLPAEVVEAAGRLWNVLDGTVAISDLWMLVDFDDYGICLALLELLKTRQIEEIALNSGPIVTGEQSLVPPNLVLGLQTPLAANDQLCALSVEPSYGLPRVRRGRLRGSLNKEDANHLLHDIRLLPQAEGCPILKDGQVIGIHCGPMPYGQAVQAKEGSLQQLVWVEALIDCLKQLGVNQSNTTAVALPAPGTNGQSTLMTLVDFQPGATAGCHDIANLSCPKCGSASACSASECKSCGQRFFPDYVERPKRGWEVWTYVSLAVLLIVAIFWTPPTSPPTSAAIFSLVANPEWVSTKVAQIGEFNHKQKWIVLTPGQAVQAQVPTAFKILLNKACHVYIVDKSSHEAGSLVAYPNTYPVPKYTNAKDQLLPESSPIALPEVSLQVGFDTSPQDTVILFASNKELPFVTDKLDDRAKQDESAKLADSAFNRANSILGIDVFSPAVEVPLSHLIPTDSAQAQGDPIVYVKRLIQDGHRTQF